jgi:hypothetical protein
VSSVLAADVSAETAAWIAAAGAAGGALIGATAGGVVNFVLERVRERREAGVGARLVRNDLFVAASQLKSAEDSGKWFLLYEAPMEAWHTQRTALAARLTPEQFEVVSQAVTRLELLTKWLNAIIAGQITTAKIDEIRDKPRVVWMPVGEDAQLRQFRVNATAAYNTLQRLAGGERIDSGLLFDEAPVLPSPRAA